VTTDPRCPVCQESATVTPHETRQVSNITEVLVWKHDCPGCGEFCMSEVDRAGLLGYPPWPPPLPPAPGEAPPEPVSYPTDRMHLVSSYLRELTIAGHGGITVTAESSRTMADAAPRTVPERTNRLLINLAGVSRYAGERIEIFPDRDCQLAYASNGQELMSQLHYLMLDGLLEDQGVLTDPPIFRWAAVSLKGWARVEQLRSGTTSFSQAFVAMSFDPALAWIYTQGIEPAVRDAGYQPLILSRQEHADRVDERIVLELNRSRFVVAEFTQHRPSVYFEAGYAVGRGLPVIWTCRDEDYEAAHFDTRQYNHIVWRTADELRERLYTRIKVVVG
jgi:hypothetical protein